MPPRPPVSDRKTRIDLTTIDGIRHEVNIDPATGCWNWRRHLDREGYASVSGKRASRAVATLVYGDLGNQPVHHICANRRCVNPEHLQPISHRENAAEMLERNWYLTHIADLRDALSEWAPLHPLLDVTPPPNAAPTQRQPVL
jgi:hypothetical protein